MRRLLLVALVLCGACGKSAGGARTVVLVTVDTLRRDHVGAYGADRAKTPSIDGLARTGLRFDDARTPAPLTLPAHTTMFSGLPPAVHGVRTNTASRLPDASARGFRLVAERFAEAGRCCGAFVSAQPLAPEYGLPSGFEAYDADGLSGGPGAATYRRRPGADTVRRALAWVATRPKDDAIFLWVHLFDPHEPHAGTYAADVETADRAVGMLLAGLEQAGRGDAAILLAADHGEALGDLLEPSHGFLLGESVLRIPFVIRAPGVAPGVRADPVDLADVAPTLLALGGLAPPPPPDVPGAGLDLLAGTVPADRPRVAESFHGYHQHRWAQLSAAIVGPFKVEDRGAGRERLQRLDAPDAARSDGGPAANRPEATKAFDVLRAYRRVEDHTPRPDGQAPGGYGTGGIVGFFLDPEANAALPDPYAVITDDARLQMASVTLARNPPFPPSVLEATLRDPIGVLKARSPGDPSVVLWEGRFLRALGRHADALASFDRALELGGPSAETVLLAARSERALGRHGAALERLDRARSALRPDPRLEAEAAEALRSLGRAEEADRRKAAAETLKADRAAPPTLAPCR